MEKIYEGRTMELMQQVVGLLKVLSPIEQTVLRYRFGLGGKQLTIAEIGYAVGLSPDGVNQVAEQAVEKLRNMF